MKQKICTPFLLLFLLILFLPQHFSCKKVDIQREVLVMTGQADEITYQSAYLNGSVLDAGEEGSVSEYGFVYSNSGLPTLDGVKIKVGDSDVEVGSFAGFVEDLESNSMYYFRSYALESSGNVSYGNILNFETPLHPDATIPVVATLQVLDTSSFSAKITGIVSENGLAPVTRRGFCIGEEEQPELENSLYSENGQGVGEFENHFTSLIPNTQYFVRAYAENELGLSYGEQLVFTTLESGGTVSEWLHYDDGQNDDGIGLTGSGGFDVAIRFSSEQLAPFNGLKVSRIKFFPKVGAPAQYILNVFVGENPTLEALVVEQVVDTLVEDQWNDVLIGEPHIIDASQEMWVGYYVHNLSQGMYPAGIDDGPGETGYSDLISVDNLATWATLGDVGINANWNIQVYVTNEAGEEILFSVEPPRKSERSNSNNSKSQISSSRQATR